MTQNQYFLKKLKSFGRSFSALHLLNSSVGNAQSSSAVIYIFAVFQIMPNSFITQTLFGLFLPIWHAKPTFYLGIYLKGRMFSYI